MEESALTSEEPVDPSSVSSTVDDEKYCNNITDTSGPVICLTHAISVNETVTSAKPIDLH